MKGKSLKIISYFESSIFKIIVSASFSKSFNDVVGEFDIKPCLLKRLILSTSKSNPITSYFASLSEEIIFLDSLSKPTIKTLIIKNLLDKYIYKLYFDIYVYKSK